MYRKKFRIMIILLAIILLIGCSEEKTLSSIFKRKNFDALVMFNSTKSSIILNTTILDENYELIADTTIIEISDEERNYFLNERPMKKGDLNIVFNTLEDSVGTIVLAEDNSEAYLLKKDKRKKEVIMYSIKPDSDFNQFCEMVANSVEKESVIE